MGLNAGLRPGLARLARDGGSPEQFQFGIRRIWLDCLETDTEAYAVVAVTGGESLRLAERRCVPPLLQEPPRRPDASPMPDPQDRSGHR